MASDRVWAPESCQRVVQAASAAVVPSAASAVWRSSPGSRLVRTPVQPQVIVQTEHRSLNAGSERNMRATPEIARFQAGLGASANPPRFPSPEPRLPCTKRQLQRGLHQSVEIRDTNNTSIGIRSTRSLKDDDISLCATQAPDSVALRVPGKRTLEASLIIETDRRLKTKRQPCGPELRKSTPVATLETRTCSKIPVTNRKDPFAGTLGSALGPFISYNSVQFLASGSQFSGANYGSFSVAVTQLLLNA